MPARVTFKANRAGITALALGPKAQAVVLQRAEAAKAAAEAIAPRQSGHYADSFDVTPTTVVIKGKPRAGARLSNTADYATVIEIGRRGQDGQHVLSRALDAIRHA
jgi:hypothetical protein